MTTAERRELILNILALVVLFACAAAMAWLAAR